MSMHAARPLMRPAERRWVIPAPPPREAVESLARSLSLPPALCRILAVRGFADIAAARDYLRPQPSHIHDPLRLAGMGDAVTRLAAALRNGERILVHGDYDVDG